MCVDSTSVGHMATIASGSRKCIAGFCKYRVEREKAWDTDEMEQMFRGGSFGTEGQGFNAVRELRRYQWGKQLAEIQLASIK